ncbi:MAG: outer membrane lipoprotein carrier protein LolA [Phycisphaerae bacterium]|nr:outer membrane lipoprotein carrier protein LolA [Gemmatimonadaceae bacterium]
MSTHITFLPAMLQSVSIAALAVASPLSAQTSAADVAYDRAARAYKSFTSIDAQFEQKTTNPILGKTATSRGRFVQQKPNLVSITFTDPVGDRIVGDGKYLWVFLPSSTPNQVLRLPANSESAVIVNLLGQLLDAPRQSFVISGGESVSLDGVATKKVLLVSRTPNSAPFQRATLWIDDKDSRPIRVQIIDPQGIDRTFNMSTWTVNTTLPKDLFKFSPPKGAKVISRIP